MYSMLLANQQCMVNNAKGEQNCPLPADFMHCQKPEHEVGRQVLAVKGRTATASTAMRAAVAGGCMWMMVHIMNPSQPKLLHLSQGHSAQNALCTIHTWILQAA